MYDFRSGLEREGDVEVRRDRAVLARFKARGQFRLRMPLDSEITVTAAGCPPIRKELLLDYAPVHRFLWYLRGEDLGRPETLDRLESLVRQVDLEFPLGYRMPGGYIAAELRSDLDFRGVQVVDVAATIGAGRNRRGGDPAGQGTGRPRRSHQPCGHLPRRVGSRRDGGHAPARRGSGFRPGAAERVFAAEDIRPHRARVGDRGRPRPRLQDDFRTADRAGLGLPRTGWGDRGRRPGDSAVIASEATSD